MDIKISIALVTRNRPESLERCLKSWRSQTISPYEIVVSDDSSPNFAHSVEELCKKYDCKYVKGPQKGLYSNRNNAALSCKGTHILTGDDDHTHPVDYLEKINMLLKEDAKRIWILGEKNTLLPDWELMCPGELQADGVIRSPKDPSDCAAIADGSTVYPREVFDSGLRYDDTYNFGGLWYLWGVILVKKGWKISYSDSTFIWHHGETDSRKVDEKWLADQIECEFYVALTYAWRLNPTMTNNLRALYNIFKKTIFKTSIFNYDVKVRVKPSRVLRVVKNVLNKEI